MEARHEFLEQWTQTSGALQTEVANYLKGHFLSEPLRDWDVSRPAPYFGFEIPDSPGDYWYVWFDAPIGYMASLQQWCDRHGEKFDAWWPKRQWSVDSGQWSDKALRHQAPGDQTPPAEIHHFIGKDISYFHTLFWPRVLVDAGFQLPTKIHIHGFLNVGGEKMSKSKGTFIQAATYLKHLNPAYLRYYYASKLSPRVDDLDLNPDEFVMKVNSDLVGKVVNLASRTARFVEESGLSPTYPDDGGLFASAAEEGTSIVEAYENCDFNRAMRQIMQLADRANQFVDAKAPWTLRKEAARAAELQNICTIALNLFRQLAIYLAPVLPKLAEQTGELLNQPITSWSQATSPLVGTRINKFQNLLTRVEPTQVQSMLDETKEASTANAVARRWCNIANRSASPRLCRGVASIQRRPGATASRTAGRRMHDRRFHQSRSACRPHPHRRGGSRGPKAAQAHAQPRRRSAEVGLRRNQKGVQARRFGRPAGHLRCQPAAAADEIRLKRRHGRRRRLRGR